MADGDQYVVIGCPPQLVISVALPLVMASSGAVLVAATPS
jgi:hypothetical protein